MTILLVLTLKHLKTNIHGNEEFGGQGLKLWYLVRIWNFHTCRALARMGFDISLYSECISSCNLDVFRPRIILDFGCG